MNWGALLAGLIGASIPGMLTYVGLRRARQSSDAETFGPASAQAKLGTVHHDMGWQVTAEDMLGRQGDMEWFLTYRQAHSEAQAAMDELIVANFDRGWPWLGRRRHWLRERLGRA